MVNAKYIPTLLLLLAATLASCVYDDAPATRDDDARQAVQVTFTLAAGNAPAETRAEGTTWGDDYPSADATAWENAIDRLQVLVYDKEGTTRVGQVENLIRFSNADGQSYTYHGQLTTTGTELTRGTSYKFVILANIDPNLTDNNNPLEDLTFEQNAANIPMWGVTTQTLTLTPGTADNLGSIDLLRAMAKVEVCLSDELKDEYTLKSVTLNRYNKTGYCLPAGYNDVSETTELDREGSKPASFNPCPSLANDIIFTTNADNGTAVCYLPEYANDDANPAQLTITLTNEGTDKEYTLDLKDYTTDAYYNLVRNHIYRYTITDVNDGTLTVKYRVLPWEVVSSEIGWSDKIEYSLLPSGAEEKNLTSGDVEAVYCIVNYPRYVEGSNNNYDKLEDDRGCARFTFTLTGPKGTVWKAHLSNEKDFYFSENQNTEQNYFVSNGIARKDPYTIQINPQNKWTENASFEDKDLTDWGRTNEETHTIPSTYFYITISVDGKHEVELEINPPTSYTTTQIYKEGRRFAGTNTRIWIRQLRAVKGLGLRKLAQNVDPTSKDFEWWRVNPYWN